MAPRSNQSRSMRREQSTTLVVIKYIMYYVLCTYSYTRGTRRSSGFHVCRRGPSTEYGTLNYIICTYEIRAGQTSDTANQERLNVVGGSQAPVTLVLCRQGYVFCISCKHLLHLGIFHKYRTTTTAILQNSRNYKVPASPGEHCPAERLK